MLVVFEPEDFIARLAALMPKPRNHLTRYRDLFAPASPHRAQVVPGTRAAVTTERGEAATSGRIAAMNERTHRHRAEPPPVADTAVRQTGRFSVNTDPSPTLLRTDKEPSSRSANLPHSASPSPVPP